MSLTILPADCAAISKPNGVGTPSHLERVLRIMSVVTMLMTVPQVWTIWIDGNARGVSILSWGAYLVSACLWFAYGLHKHDKTIYIACIGWIVLDAAIVAGVVVHS
jgi:uncharacterized protein with PQ loop repeat